MTITVPIPHKCLSPNARTHWAAKVKHKKLARCLGEAAVYGIPIADRPFCKAYTMNVVWYAPTSHAIDDDNAWARLKQTRDGIAYALHVDDKVIRQGSMTFAKDKANPRLEITLEAREV